VYINTNELTFIYSLEFHINVKYLILIVNITIILFSIVISNESLSFFSLLYIIGVAEIVKISTFVYH